nr:PREDICTED: ribosomal protein 63, mitochondrial [Linepithema humile]
MRLGSVLFAITKIPYRFRGKYRKVKKPTLQDLFNMKHDFEREERNMLILRHPYITLQQSHGHTGETKQSRKDKFLTKIYAEHRQKFQKEITIAERLCHMRVTEAWD